MSSESKIVERTRWFREAGLGLFIHWGVYSVLGRGEWVKQSERIPDEEYDLLTRKFVPRKDFAEEWVNIALKAGMKYIVLTAKHHDGFSLFDSKVSDFTAPKSAAGRDLVREFVRACRKRGMRIGFYYSPPDWHIGPHIIDPKKDRDLYARWAEYVQEQLNELCTQYGRIDILWLDGGVLPELRKTVDRIRSLQPSILINNRGGFPGDFDTPEKEIKPAPPGRLWEMCQTTNEHWGYCAGDIRWRPLVGIIHEFVTVASLDGNYLLNIGPKANGSFPPQAKRLLKGFGSWIKVNGESVFATHCSKVTGGSIGTTTACGSTVYLHLLHYPGREACIISEGNRVLSAKILVSGEQIEVKQKGERVFLRGLPSESPDPLDTVIVLKMEQDAGVLVP